MKAINLIFALLLLSVTSLFSQRAMDPQLAALRDDKDTVALEQKLSALKNSPNENDLRLLMQYYNMQNQNGKAEDIFKLAQKRFPKGQLAFVAAGNALITTPDPQTKETLYKNLVRDFPNRDYTMQQYSIAASYADLNNKKKVLEYAGKFTEPMYKDQFYHLLAEQMLKNGDLVTTEYLLKQALDSAKKQMLAFDSTKPALVGPPRSAASLKMKYYSYLATHAKLLFKKGKTSEAFTEAKEAYDNSNHQNTDLNDFYTTVLLATGRMKEALPLMEDAIKKGIASEKIKTKLKDAYVAVHGSEEGFAAYKDKLDQALYNTTKEKIAKLIINKPSKDFTLLNVNGTPVSLHDLKGKTVVLDFWATWCGPCKKSFPAMQLAVNKYKNDPDVKFLFIHTWERGNLDPAVDAKKYITDHHYSFEVLVDRKDPATAIDKVVTDYGVSGIPTKFIIDGNGNIRFKFTGFTAGDDAAVEEVSMMIEMARGKTTARSGVSGKTGMGDGMLNIMYRKMGGGFQFDSTAIVDGQFKFEKELSEPVITVISVKNKPGEYRSLLLTPGNDITINAPSNFQNASFSGTGAPDNQDYQDYLDQLNNYVDKMNQTLGKLKDVPLDATARERRITEIQDSINLERDQQVYLKFAMAKPQSPVGALAVLNYAAEPVWRPRKKINPQEIEKLVAPLSKEFLTYPSFVSLQEELEVSKATGPGKPIIDFTLADTSGKMVKLSDFKGKYVFLDFWASWCVPCRKENPNVKKQFEKYKDKGFTVVSVSLDKPGAKQAWVDAIKKDGIDQWTHLGDLNGFNGEVAKRYYVKSIPTNFLIGPDGKFIGRNLYAEQLAKELAKLFK